ncbi:MAG: GNAT family N-acetyltransferase [Planctomycetes bacterium]|nr:GNAT family N-acetyltransferase [Planctomycetota bacterium]
MRVDATGVRLRPVERRDLATLFEFEIDAESNALAGTKPRTREAFFAAWERNLVNPEIHARVIELDGARGDGAVEIVGTIARFQANGQDHIGYWISRAHWGKGIASRALESFLDLEPRRPLHATAATNNARSRRILEKCDFVLVHVRTDQETERFLEREIAEFVLG